MVRLTLLKESEVWGKDALDVIKKCGPQHKTSPFAALVGAIVTDDNIVLPFDSGIGVAWTASPDGSGDVRCVDYYGGKTWNIARGRRPAIRLVIPEEDASKITLANMKTGKHGIVTGEFGKYPRTIVDEQTTALLKKAYKDGALIQTGKSYLLETADLDDEYKDYNLKRYPVYAYKGKEYVCVQARPIDRRLSNFMSPKELSKLRVAPQGKAVFVEVEPITWLMDEKSGKLISDECVTAGIQFNLKSTYKGDIENTFINSYLKRLAKEIESADVNELQQQKVSPRKVEGHSSVLRKENKGRGRV